jgi:hypothetical protein
VVGDEDGADTRSREPAFGAEEFDPETGRREAHAVVEPFALRENALRKRIEEIEAVIFVPRCERGVTRREPASNVWS